MLDEWRQRIAQKEEAVVQPVRVPSASRSINQTVVMREGTSETIKSKYFIIRKRRSEVGQRFDQPGVVNRCASTISRFEALSYLV